MDIIRIKNTEDLAEQIVCQMSDIQKYISVFCLYEDAREIVSDLIRCGCTAHSIELHPCSSIGYDDEFLISIIDEDEEYQVRCQPAKMDDGRYVRDYPEIAYVFEDCNSRILQHIKDAYVFEVEYDDEDDFGFECNGDCANCRLNEDDEKRVEYTGLAQPTFEVNKNNAKYKMEAIKMDDDMKGFTISTSDDYGYSSFSFHSTDEDLVRRMLKDYKKF